MFCPKPFTNMRGGNIRNTFQLSKTGRYNLYKGRICCCIALGCTGVPNKVTRERMLQSLRIKMMYNILYL